MRSDGKQAAGPPLHRVLLVEDDEAVAESFIFALAAMRIELVWVRSVGEALGRLGERWTAVVADYTLPDGIGLTVLEAARARDSATRTALMTGWARGEVPSGGRHVDRVFFKPFTAADLARMVLTA